jgi:hypothetical protein
VCSYVCKYSVTLDGECVPNHNVMWAGGHLPGFSTQQVVFQLIKVSKS